MLKIDVLSKYSKYKRQRQDKINVCSANYQLNNFVFSCLEIKLAEMTTFDQLVKIKITYLSVHVSRKPGQAFLHAKKIENQSEQKFEDGKNEATNY